MQKVLTAESMRQVDQMSTDVYGIPTILLMENAAYAIFELIEKIFNGVIKDRYVLIFCGKGNNGGDGAALARILWAKGANCFVYFFDELKNTKGDAKINFDIVKKVSDWSENSKSNDNRLIFSEELDSRAADIIQSKDCIVIDALFGTGLTQPLRDKFQQLVDKINKRKPEIPLISIDIPSGLDSDLPHQIGENIKADFTVTFTAPKIANVLPPASNFNGKLIVANIGSPQELVDNSLSKLYLAESKDVQHWLEKTNYAKDSYKNKRGHALLIVGAREYTGAAVLAGNAAMVSGVGLTTVATSKSAHKVITAKILEEIITRGLPETKNGAVSEKAFENIEELFEKIDVVGIGCGLDSSEKTTKNFVRKVVEKRKSPVVIDADALNALSPFNLNGSDNLPLILTPHEGEFLRLLGTKNKEIIKDRVKAVREFAEKHNVILVLKGERVLIGAPDGTVVINPTGNSGLGKAGNGDTLTGIITGFIAQAGQMKINIFETVVTAVYISGMAGDIAAEKFGKRTMLASDVRQCLREAFDLVEEQK